MHQKAEKESLEQDQKIKEQLNEYCGLFLSKGKSSDFDKTIMHFQRKDWFLCKSLGEIQVFTSKSNVNLSGNLQLAADSFKDIKSNRKRPNIPCRDFNTYLLGLSSAVGLNILQIPIFSHIIFCGLIFLIAIAYEEFKFKGLKSIYRDLKIKFDQDIAPIYVH